MPQIFQEKARVAGQEQIAEGICSMWLECPDIAMQARPGQFLSLYCADRSRLLPRPISICETDSRHVRMVYRTVGAGTREFSSLKAGSLIDVLGPLGNGYPVETISSGASSSESGPEGGGGIFLMGGGIGIPPLVGLARALPGKKTAVLGFRDETFLTGEFREADCTLLVATEDGSAGTKGNVLDAIREYDSHPDLICACGPAPMLRAVKQFAQERQIGCYLSLEARMACGIGACLGCVCPSAQTDEHSRVKNKRVCADGPVFRAQDIVI